MLARHLRTAGLARPQVLVRVAARLREQGVTDPDEALALTELVAPAGQADGAAGAPAVRFHSATERHVLIRRVVERLAQERAVVVWLDDVQWGLDALAFAAHLLDAQAAAPAPVLLVLCARAEALAERRPEAERWRALAARVEVVHVAVGPLELEHRSALVRELLGLSGELAARVEERTAGNPLFAVQLVEDWVERHVLEPSEGGFRLQPGARAELPDDLHEVWAARVARVLAGRPDADAEGRGLELAAVLGQVVDTAEWQAVCDRAGGARASPDLVETLAAQRLAQTSKREAAARWSFIHGMLRESLERRAREAGRWEAHHRACARALEERLGAAAAGAPTPGPAERRDLERLGRHLVAAGEREAALSPLLRSARHRIGAGDYLVAEALLDDRERALAELALPAGDARWGEGWVLWSQAVLMQGRVAEAGRRAAAALRAARRWGWREVEARALLERARVTWDRGQLDRTARRLHDAERAALAAGVPALAADARRSMATVLMARGAFDEAAQAYRAAHEDFAALGDEAGAGLCCQGLGLVYTQAGRLDEAHDQLQRAWAHFERGGSRVGLAGCRKALADVARLRGALEEAEAGYREACVRHEALGSADAVIAEANLGLVLLDRGRWAEARVVLEACLRRFDERGRVALVGCTHACLLPCLAGEGDWPAWDRHLARATALLAETGFTYLDIARSAHLAGDMARGAGEPARARAAYALALRQWRALGRADDAARAQASFSSIVPDSPAAP
jgi:tetratricopeptide (TPR) repeat protein